MEKVLHKNNNFIKEEEYPVPDTWKEVYRQAHPIQSSFFEALYKTRRNSQNY